MPAASERLSAALADRYRIERELGAGGMATVYLAADLKHDRKGAIKVLKPELAAVLGAERFVQEIKTTAALSHPHILPLFDSGTADGFLFYVMPYIQGETIREKLSRETQFPIDEGVRVAREVADALDYAHRHGVIHRDIKPENLLLHDGRPMVMDFGIALAVSAAAGGRMTETGLSLGTPHYMSPEQATAEKEITPRSDIYSLASVLYEMLAGVPPHEGGSAQQTIMRIIADTPRPLTELRKSVPANVAAAVAKALEKLPADRFDTAKAFADALANPAFRVGEAVSALSGASRATGGWRRAAALLGLTTVGFAALATWALTFSDSAPRDVGLTPTAPMQVSGAFRSYALARDGSFVVYVAATEQGTQLWYRSLHGPETFPIPGTEGAGGTPRLSPDGARVAFVALGELKVTAIAGGTVTTLAPAQDPMGGEWLDDGKLFFGDRDGRVLRWVDVATGTDREVVVDYCLQPQLVGVDRVICGGGARKYAALIHLDRPLERRPFRQSRRASESGAPALLIGSDFRVIDGRYLAYMSIDGTLMATRIEDLDSLTVGRAVPILPGVRRASYSGAGQFDLSSDGSLSIVPGINADVGRLLRATRSGRLDTLAVEAAAFLRFTPSPDGQRIAAVIEGTQRQELYLFDLQTRAREPVDTAFYIAAPAWSPDGRSLAYVKQEHPGRELILTRRLDAAGAPRVLATFEPPRQLNVSAYLSPDSLLVGSGVVGSGAFLVDASREPARLDTLPLNSFFLSISPDRRWIAWQPNGVNAVYLQPWPAMDRRYLVAADGYEPRWASANELFYLSGYTAAGQVISLQRTRIDTRGPTPVMRSETVIRDSRFVDTPGWSHAPTKEGDPIYLQSPSENLGFYVRIVPGWVDRMKRAVDDANRH